jgi:propionate catabolism operon transcriptional regulator
VPVIAADLLKRALARHGAPTAHARALKLLLPRLVGYGWPGNVRELENVVERVALLFSDDGGEVRVDEAALDSVMPELLVLPPALPAPDAPASPPAADLRSARQAEELRQIRRVVAECGGNLSAAARRLRIGRTTLYRKLSD